MSKQDMGQAGRAPNCLATPASPHIPVPKLLASFREAEAALGQCQSSIKKLANEGKLESVYIGRRHMLTVESIRRVASGGARD